MRHGALISQSSKLRGAGSNPLSVDRELGSHIVISRIEEMAHAAVRAASLLGRITDASRTGSIAMGAIGGSFASILLCILWVAGAFEPRCPSPVAEKTTHENDGGRAGQASDTGSVQVQVNRA